MAIHAFEYTIDESRDTVGSNSENEEQAFELLFRAYYVKLAFFANKFINDQPAAEEIVSETFTRLWEERSKLQINVSLNAYLYRSVQNRCLNYLKHKKVESEYVNYLARHNMLTEIPELNRNPFQEKELQEQVQKAIQELPEKCRQVFELSRFENLKNREIAESLNISQKTVERHITIALDRLRLALRHLFVFFAFLSERFF